MSPLLCNLHNLRAFLTAQQSQVVRLWESRTWSKKNLDSEPISPKGNYWEHSVGGTSAGFGKSLLKHSKSFQIQSETSGSTHEYSKSNCAIKYIMLLSNFGNEHRRLSSVFCHQLVLIPLTALWKKVRRVLILPGVQKLTMDVSANKSCYEQGRLRCKLKGYVIYYNHSFVTSVRNYLVTGNFWNVKFSHDGKS